ncbi:hypothetical protein HYT01_00660 [Candidatus Giovannonibacteria bacterium]|nr:hypothetical protein [Candidatus Giovannonibacteria bacterium]
MPAQITDFLQPTLNLISGFDVSPIIFWWKFLASLVSLAAFLGIIYCAIKINEIGVKIRQTAGGEESMNDTLMPSGLEKSKAEWEAILQKGVSDDENERKFAIISADSLLDKIFKMAGYAGENLGERLKQIERGDIINLDGLWEAHKVRNLIAHETSFRLSKEEALRVLTLYGKVLRELEYIS